MVKFNMLLVWYVGIPVALYVANMYMNDVLNANVLHQFGTVNIKGSIIYLTINGNKQQVYRKLKNVFSLGIKCVGYNLIKKNENITVTLQITTVTNAPISNDRKSDFIVIET